MSNIIVIKDENNICQNPFPVYLSTAGNRLILVNITMNIT